MGSKYSTDFLRALADMKPGRTQLSPYERTRLRDIATELDLAGERATHLQSETDEAWEAYNDVSDREAHLLGVVAGLHRFKIFTQQLAAGDYLLDCSIQAQAEALLADAGEGGAGG